MNYLHRLPGFLLLIGVASLALPLAQLAPELDWLGLRANTLQNLAIVLLVAPYGVQRGLRRTWNEPLVAIAVLLVVTFTASSTLPGLGAFQSLRSAAALALALVVFEFRIDSRTGRRLLWLLASLALISLAAGVALQLAGVRPAYRFEWGAFRLQGATVPAHLAQLAVIGMLVSLHRARRDPRLHWLAIAHFAVLTWTGTRLAMLEAFLILVVHIGLRTEATAWGEAWRLRRAGTALAAALVLATYLPNLGLRLVPDTPFRHEVVEVRLPTPESASTARQNGEGLSEEPKPEDREIEERQSEEGRTDQQGAEALRSYERETAQPDGVRLTLATAGRLRAWRFFYDVAREDIWFGRGLGAGVSANRGQLSYVFRGPHNEYLRMLVDGGVVGLTVVLAGFLLLALRLVRFGPRDHRVELVLAFAIFFLDATLRNSWMTQSFAIPFWLFVSYLSQRREGSDV